MKMRKKLLSLSILVLLTIGMLSAFDIGPVGVSAADSPSVYVYPPSTIEGPEPPNTYTIEIWTDYSDGENITAYQFSLTWNPSILEGVSVVNDGILQDWYIPPPPFPPDPIPLHIFAPGAFDNTAGSLSTTYAYFETSGQVDKNGPGKLATVTFNVVGIGDSNIILGSDTSLVGWDQVAELTYKIVNGVTMPFHLGHGYFENLPVAHDVAVTSVTPSAIDVFQGELVTIDVGVVNLGEVSETFDVTVWTGILELGTQTVTDLAAGTPTTLPFIWDTTGSAVTTYTISAVASTVAGETDTTNNALTDGDVNVKAAIAAVILGPSDALYGTSVHFDGTESYSVGATIVSYEWDLGDPHTGQPTTADTPEVDHTYKWPGVYGVTLIVTDDLGRTSILDFHTITMYELRDAAFARYQARAEKHKWVESVDGDGYVNITAAAKNLANETMVLGVKVAILDKYGTSIGPVYAEDRICPVGVEETFELLVNPYDHEWDGEDKLVMYGQVTLWIDTTFDGTPNELVDTKNIRFSVQP